MNAKDFRNVDYSSLELRVEAQLVAMRERLQSALEGIQNGLTLSDECATRVVKYMLTGEWKEN